MSTKKEILLNYLTRQPDVAVAFLFGSEASGRSLPGSDVDLAFLFYPDKVPSVERLPDIQDELTALLKKEIDLVVLNRANPIICMQVLKKGEKILQRDNRLYSDFFVRTINEYDDLKRVRSVIEKNILKGKIYG
ncbi:MAG: nucleotidyltransferase domain-containing protein [Balneolaceae bacterium]|nr:nucleotidyltransferase domain-containing protein [Balneolaceae bacterium]